MVRSNLNVVSLSPTRAPQAHSADEQILVHLDRLYRFALRLTGSADQAQDLTQETVLRAWQKRSTIMRDVRAWLFQTLYHTFISNHRRHRGREIWNLAGWDEDRPECWDDPGSVPVVIAVEDVRKAVSALPEELRAVVWLADAEGLRLREVAQALNWPLGTVASRLWRARQELRRLLSAYGPETKRQA